MQFLCAYCSKKLGLLTLYRARESRAIKCPHCHTHMRWSRLESIPQCSIGTNMKTKVIAKFNRFMLWTGIALIILLALLTVVMGVMAHF